MSDAAGEDRASFCCGRNGDEGADSLIEGKGDCEEEFWMLVGFVFAGEKVSTAVMITRVVLQVTWGQIYEVATPRARIRYL